VSPSRPEGRLDVGPGAVEVGSGLALLVRGRFTGPAGHVPAALLVDGRARSWRAALGAGSEYPGYAWAIVELDRAGPARLRLAMAFDGARPAGEVLVQVGPAPTPPPAVIPAARREARIAVCLATHDPEPGLLERQLRSLTTQTHREWLAIVSDDASRPDRLAVLRELVARDERFLLLEHAERVGSYANFERAVRAVPAACAMAAFCDQDDVWRPDKLERLAAGLPEDGVVCSDARIVAVDGSVVSPTFWTTRRDLPTDVRSILNANSVPGCTMAWDTRLHDVVLPFPPQLEHLHHDGWVAAAGAAFGGIRRLEEPLVDYVQHGGNALGHFSAVNPRIGRLSHRELASIFVSTGSRHAVARLQIDTAVRPEALARTLRLRARSAGRPVSRDLSEACRSDDDLDRILDHLARGARTSVRHGLRGTELSVARGLAASRLSRSVAAGLVGTKRPAAG
jgi:hypothetical protein